MTLRITRPYFADCAKGSIFPGFRLTTAGQVGYLVANPWPPARPLSTVNGARELFALRAKAAATQNDYTLAPNQNATMETSRTTFPAQGRRITITVRNTAIDWGAVTGARTYYLAGRPPAGDLSTASPCPL